MLTHSDACLPTLAASVTKRPCPRARRQCQGGRGGQGGGLERERVAAYAANGGQAGGGGVPIATPSFLPAEAVRALAARGMLGAVARVMDA